MSAPSDRNPDGSSSSSRAWARCAAAAGGCGGTSGAEAAGANAAGGAAARGGVGSDTGCSSRETIAFGAAAGAPMRSWNGLPCASRIGAGGGTIFGGVVSALITGGVAGALAPDVKAR